jgi:hypothetical protein
MRRYATNAERQRAYRQRKGQTRRVGRPPNIVVVVMGKHGPTLGSVRNPIAIDAKGFPITFTSTNSLQQGVA